MATTFTGTGRLVLPNALSGAVFLIGRQPIFDAHLEVYGYELLYRPTRENYVNIGDGDQATLAVFLNTFSQAGLKTIVGSRKAFINVTRNFLEGLYPIPLPAEQVVLEILEETAVDAGLIRTLKEIAGRGYQIALDDVTDANRALPLAESLHYVKVDVAAVEPESLPALVVELKKQPVCLVAEKVETMEEFQRCKAMGFDLFQGFFFCRPEIISGRKVNSSRFVVLRLLANLQDPDVRLEQLERILSIDVTLGYRLLKLVNSSYYSLASPITSIRHAIALIGLNQLKSWLSLLLMARIQDKPHELSQMALFRARMAELLALELRAPRTDPYFLAGLFSILDAILDLSMQEVVEGLSLADEIVAALLSRQGQVGAVLQAILSIEAGDWDPVLRLVPDPNRINAIYIEAVEGANRLKDEVL